MFPNPSRVPMIFGEQTRRVSGHGLSINTITNWQFYKFSHHNSQPPKLTSYTAQNSDIIRLSMDSTYQGKCSSRLQSGLD